MEYQKLTTAEANLARLRAATSAQPPAGAPAGARGRAFCAQLSLVGLLVVGLCAYFLVSWGSVALPPPPPPPSPAAPPAPPTAPPAPPQPPSLPPPGLPPPPPPGLPDNWPQRPPPFPPPPLAPPLAPPGLPPEQPPPLRPPPQQPPPQRPPPYAPGTLAFLRDDTCVTQVTDGGVTSDIHRYNNGLCEDGGAGSTSSVCPFGSDFTDCGDREIVVPTPPPSPAAPNVTR